MTDHRPVFLNVFRVALPVAALTSILHRISGVLLFAAAAYLLWLGSVSVSSKEQFNGLVVLLENPIHALILWVTLTLLGYHFIAGIRHLLLDLHIGDSKSSGTMSAYLVLVLSLGIAGLSAWWIWL